MSSSCTQVASGPTVASLGAGSDAAYLNATRGRPDAQISKDQAEQYSRQRNQVAEEMSIEQMKKQHFLQNLGAATRVVSPFLRY